MRVSIVFAGITSLGLILMAAACSEEVIVQGAPTDTDGGGTSGKSSSGTSGSSGDPGDDPDSGKPGTSSSGATVTITPKSVKTGDAIILGVTSDDQIVFIGIDGQATSLQVVPVAGGAPETIEATFDLDTANATVIGGAVGYWTGIDETTGIGTFNVWTKAGGKKAALSTTSTAGLFTASDDGTRIAFSTATAGALSNLAVVSSATPGTITGILAAADRINLAAAQGAAGAAPTCSPRLRFGLKNLIATFCVGASATETNARMYWVPENTTTEVRLDDKGPAAGPVKTAFFADKNATKIFAVSAAAAGTGRVITPTGTPTSVALEDGSGTAGFITDDGANVVYRTATGGMKRASTGATPAPKTLVAGAKALLGITPDKTRLFFANAPGAQLTDIQTADTTTENQTAKALVAGATARPLGITATGELFLYAEGTKIQAQAVAGGTPKDISLPKAAGAAATGKGNGVILLTDPKKMGTAPNEITLVSLQYIDAMTGKFSDAFTTGVPTDGLAIAKEKLVYSTIGTGAGIFVVSLP